MSRKAPKHCQSLLLLHAQMPQELLSYSQDKVPIGRIRPGSQCFILTRSRVQMGRQLMVDFPSFLANIQSMDKILQNLLEDAPLWSLEG